MEPNNAMLIDGTKALQKESMTLGECAEYLGISRWTLTRLKKRKEIPYVPFGRVCRFYRTRIDEWKKQRTIEARD